MRLFNEIKLNNIRGDFFGGITAAVIALPMALAFGVASGAGAEAGLYGAILIGFFAAIFGGTPTLISEPTGPMTVVFTAVIATMIAKNPENGLAMAFTVVVLAGIFQVIFGMLRLGKYVTMMPYSVVSGFMSGIGIILIILQIAPILGHAAPEGGVLGVIKGIPELIRDIKPNELLLAAVTLTILFVMPSRVKRYVPPQLIALVTVTVVSLLFFSEETLRRIGEIPVGLPQFRLPVFSFADWQAILIDAIVLGLLGAIDALLTAVIADSITRGEHDSDKELFGQGIGNIMSGLFGGLPGAGATMGTVVSIQSGARSALAGIIRSGLLLIVILWAAGLTAVIPLAVLAGIALKVGIDIIDWSFLKRAHRISFNGALLTYGVILLTVFVDLIVAVGIGLFIANIFTVMKLSRLQADQVRVIDSPEQAALVLEGDEQRMMKAMAGHILLFQMSGSMIFGTSRAISRTNSELEGRNTLIVDLTEVTHLGVSASLALEAAILDMLQAGRTVYVVGANTQAKRRLSDLGLVDKIPSEHLVDTRVKALELAYAKYSSAPR